MTQFASDTFTGTDGTELATYSASWVKHSASGARSASIKTNQVKSDSASEIVYYHTGTPASADYYVAADIYINSNNSSAAVLGRVDTAANTWYLVQLDDNANVWNMYKRVAGTWTQLGSNVSETITAGNTYPVKLDMVGTAIKAYLNGSGSAGISVTDSAISAAGKAGIRFDTGSDTLRIDAFDATDTSGGATSFPPIPMLLMPHLAM